MTRSFNSRIRCPECGHQHTMETEFERWMRNHPHLDSSVHGVVRFDLDVLLHQYKADGSRDAQAMMVIEVKTNNAAMTRPQEDTLYLFDQAFRNVRRDADTLDDRMKHRAHKAYSVIAGRKVDVWLFGSHILTLQGTQPSDQEWMRWDNWNINMQHLVELLQFKRNPDRPKLMLDW